MVSRWNVAREIDGGGGGGATYQILVQVLADVRCELHRADKDEKYAEQHRKRL